MKIYGAPYPVEKHPLGYLHTQTGLNQIKSDLLILLLTNPGERVMLPDFGTPLRRLVFDPNDSTLRMQAREMIIKSIERWEPRITIEAIEVTGADMDTLNPEDAQEDLDHILTIKIKFFDPQDIQNIQTLVLAVPLPNATDTTLITQTQKGLL